MPFVQISGMRSAFARMQWRRGMRAAFAVGMAMFACLQMHRPMGWAALGSLYVCLIDNGGPYRTRLGNMLAVSLLGSTAVLLGSLAGASLSVGVPATLAVCFFITLARVISQPMAASSVFVLICYVVAFGHTEHGLATGLGGALQFLLGGAWASLLALILWPLDPFRPARIAVANIYASLLRLAAALPETGSPPGLTHFNELLAQTRLSIEAAQRSITATPARQTARTVRARNLTVLTESADLLLARVLRFAELAELSSHSGAAAAASSLEAIHRWLLSSLSPVESALRERPQDNTKGFSPVGSLSLDLHRSEPLLESAVNSDPHLRPEARAPMIAALRDALYNIEIAYESVRAIWIGAESRQQEAARFRASLTGDPPALFAPLAWLESLRANLTFRSVMFRYALRLSTVVAVDMVLIRHIHVTHGYWLAMTSLIVLRPYAGETVRRSVERVTGTVAGGILAAAFTAIFASHTEIMFLVVLCSAGAVALYAVDYAWYCFFLTPTIVLLTLPRMHDWHLAAARTEMTVLGAAISVFAMLVLWPERESQQLPRLLARAAAADAAYLRAMLAFWQRTTGQTPAARFDAERALLAPARRLCGLAVNDAEETLDHALLEHAIPLNPQREPTEQLNRGALTFTTYLRRITRTTTTLAAVGLDAPLDAQAKQTISTLAQRLDALSQSMSAAAADTPAAPSTGTAVPDLEPSLAVSQMMRLQRQVSILERTAADLLSVAGAKPR
jgi:uncharacterized membrane protein YccC